MGKSKEEADKPLEVPFSVGQTVRLKSGSVLMTVESVDPKQGYVGACWMFSGKVETYSGPYACFKPATE